MVGARKDRSSPINGKHGHTGHLRHLRSRHGRTFVPNGNEFAHDHSVIRASSGTRIVVNTLFQRAAGSSRGLFPTETFSRETKNKCGTNAEFGESIYWSGNTGSTPFGRSVTACPHIDPNTKRRDSGHRGGAWGGSRRPTRRAPIVDKPRFTSFVRR